MLIFADTGVRIVVRLFAAYNRTTGGSRHCQCLLLGISLQYHLVASFPVWAMAFVPFVRGTVLDTIGDANWLTVWSYTNDDVPYVYQLAIRGSQVNFNSRGRLSGWHGTARCDDLGAVELQFDDDDGHPALRKNALLLQTATDEWYQRCRLEGRDYQTRRIVMKLQDLFRLDADGTHWIRQE